MLGFAIRFATGESHWKVETEMAKHNMDGLLSLISGKRGGELVNIKLFRGDRELVCAEELENQIHSAAVQLQMGKAKVSAEFPDSPTEPRDVRALLAG